MDQAARLEYVFPLRMVGEAVMCWRSGPAPDPSNIRLMLLILAFLLFVLHAFGVSHPRGNVNFQSLGLAMWVLTLLIG